MTIKIRGKLYPNAKVAAKAVGVKVCTIYSALHRGTLETVGLGTGNCKKVPRGGTPKPIKIGDMQFPSLAAAAVYLGYEKKSLSKILRHGKQRSKENIMRRFLAKKAELENQAMRERTFSGWDYSSPAMRGSRSSAGHAGSTAR